jgi:uncharacterized membrane protein YecN with MAPEG domain
MWFSPTGGDCLCERRRRVKLKLNQAGRSFALRTVIAGALTALTVAPVSRLVYILATTGAGNPSNDDAALFKLFIGPVLSGQYDWSRLPHDTFLGSHFDLLPALVLLLFARFARYDIQLILYTGIILAVIRLLLYHDALTRSAPVRNRTLRLVLWPALAALIFSMTMISAFEFDFIAIEFGLAKLGLALGVWALAKWPGRWPGVLVMALGGLIASFSFATGLATWPVFLIGMVLLDFRKLVHYITWLAACALGAAPYVIFGFFGSYPAERTTVRSLFNPRFLLNIIGRPLANRIGLEGGPLPMAEWAGTAGILLCVSGIALLWLKRRRPGTGRSAAPALMLMAYGLLSAWQISVFRETVAPWYATHSMVFWIGLAGLAYVLAEYSLAEGTARAPGQPRVWPQIRRLARTGGAWSLAACAVIFGFYVATNRSHFDKSLYLHARGPVSIACLSNYRTAPTYCECFLALWRSGFPDFVQDLARPLEVNHLSAAFSPRREWSLQGDSILDKVDFHRSPGGPEIWWSFDLPSNRAPVYDYRRLNLVLNAPNWVCWTVALPAGLKLAEFHSAAAISKSAPLRTDHKTVEFTVHIACGGEPEKLLYSQSLAADARGWYPFSVPLIEYAGRTIKLRLASNAGTDFQGGWAMFRYPYIDLSAEDAEAYRTGPDSIVPSNTDLSPAFPKPTDRDLSFDLTDSSQWDPEGMSQAASTDGTRDSWVLNDHEPHLTHRGPLDVRPADYTHVYIKMAASPGISPRAVRLHFLVGRSSGPDTRAAIIPLLAGGEMHAYTYDLRLLDLTDDARIIGIEVSPAYGPARGKSIVRLTDLRLINRNGRASGDSGQALRGIESRLMQP